MNISLLTDAPKHNLALMKISTYHKGKGDNVLLNMPLKKAEITYGSWLFKQKYGSDIVGGTYTVENKYANPQLRLPDHIDCLKPDYDLFPIDYSLGYTWAWCFRNCDFCIVPKQNNPRVHHSIWEFHDRRFNKICLLNNNTFSDPNWLDTFKEIWDAKLVVHDENGYDLRLLDEEKVDALKRTKFDSQIHFAWDYIKDESQIVKGLELLKKYHISGMVYVLIGKDTNIDEDLHRCQILTDYGCDPYPMPYNGGNKYSRAFKRFICLRGYRKYPSIVDAWKNYKP